MPKFRVQSGEFDVIIDDEKTLRKAADRAIQLHDKSNNPRKLGLYTLVERLTAQSKKTDDHVFILTEHLIRDNTSGFGCDQGQYIKEQ